MIKIQTFLPYPDFVESAKCLDYKRLGKQRVETMQIYNAMTQGGAWSNHPMSIMWKDHPVALLYYGKVMSAEWIQRGYNGAKMVEWFDHALKPYSFTSWGIQPYLDRIPWLGDKRLHSSHRAALLWKHLSFYQRLGWTETPKLDYYWPV